MQPENPKELHARLRAPIFNDLLKTWVGRGELDYERYIRTEQLLELQSPPGELVHSDELLFQITHQAQELWLKLAAHEAAELVGELQHDRLWHACARLERMLRALRCLAQEIDVLATLTPAAYQTIRRSLGNGSGQESPGYNALRLAASAMIEALERLLQRRGLTLRAVYDELDDTAADLRRLCEQYIDIDGAFQGWLHAHFQLVRRTIGVDREVKALDGLPTKVLAGRMTLPLFPALWQVRVEMTASWKNGGGYAPGAARDQEAA
ncbi:MAG TPA: tryptophan 2,3-dioxygenase family protein [Burkholderiaceae bacterium]